MSKTLRWALICVSLGILQAGTVSAERLVDHRLCKRENLNLESQKRCERKANRRSRFKARVLRKLRRTNQPPVADLKLARTFAGEAIILPGRVDLDASVSSDKDGFPELYTYQLFDDDTGQSIAGPLLTRKPVATLIVDGELPPNVRATVIVEDDDRGIDTAELFVPLEDTTTNCLNSFFTCSLTSGATTCSLTAGIFAFATGDLLDAAQRCDLTITANTPLLIAAAGGSGGNGADVWPANGGTFGRGGEARMGTTLTDLDNTYGAPGTTTYCYGIGGEGSHGNTDSGAGGASSLLRTCENVSQTKPIGLLLVAGGGGGGGASAGEGLGPSGNGAQGGVAMSTTAGACPTSCAVNSTANGGGNSGGNAGGSGGSGGTGGNGGSPNGVPGAGGIGGEGGHASGTGIAGFIQGAPQITGDTGSGASQVGTGGGAGGGGYGGGGSGGEGNGSGGGGGGGSFAAQSSRSFTNNPGSEADYGWLSFIFNYSGFINAAD